MSLLLVKKQLQKLDIQEEEYTSFDFNLLEKLGFTKTEIAEANKFICGNSNNRGSSTSKKRDLSVFDCANKCGKDGTKDLFTTWVM